jgi:acylpyruvate hydrolase
MKIICIGRNYSEHAKELINNNPFFLPDFSNEIHYEAEIVLKISRLGKNIQTKFASRYYDTIGVGIDFTARDLQDACKKAGHPWEIAKAFDQSAVINRFISIDLIPDRNAINFQLELNGITVQKGNTNDLIFSFDEIISYVSTFVTLKTGDLIFTGTPAGVGPVKTGDHLVAALEGQIMLDFHIR